MAINIDATFVSGDFIDSLDGVDDHKSVLVSCELVKLLHIVGVVSKSFLVHVEQLDATDDASLFHIRVTVCEADVDGLLHIFGHSLEFQRAERAQGQASDLGVLALQVHQEGVDGEDGKLLVLLSIVRQIKVDHLFHDHVVGSGGFDHLGVQTRHIDS